ncbi:MAG TPA: tetratricopeptide repeat protein [Terriglobia bacterium]|nr:tetratricopeptide repeat protein [Terriglobia bacterium]
MRLGYLRQTHRRLPARALSFSIVGCALIGGLPGCLSAPVPPVPAAVSAAQCPKSIHHARQALTASPNDPTLALDLARSLARCAQYPEALARYRDILKSQPNNTAVRIELGNTFRRAGRSGEACPVFRQALALAPGNLGALVGLAGALAATGNYSEALMRYDQALMVSRDDYGAMQGKAFVLYWTHQFAAARGLFERLHETNPQDAENAAPLAAIARAEEQTQPAARPEEASPRQDALAYYQERLANDPHDRQALFGMARIETEMKDFPAAIGIYRKLLAGDPQNRDAALRLALALSWNGEYPESIEICRQLLKQSPTDNDVLDGLAHAYVWSGQPRPALQIYERLLAQNPSSAEIDLAMARLELRLKDFAAARLSLATLLSVHPNNREARLELAQLELQRRRWGAARKQFEAVLKSEPRRPEALFGGARAAYYQGRLGKAYAWASEMVRGQPDDFDAVVLLANIDRARGNRRGARELLARADQISPGNPEVVSGREALEEETPFTLQTVASYAREIGRAAPGSSQAALLDEDLRTFAYGSTFSFPGIPRSESYLSLNYLPSNSPSGANQGTVGPAEFLYRQATHPIPQLTLRAGVGLVRFGPGTPIALPSSSGPQPGARFTPIGLVGGSVALNPDISFDLTWSRDAILYTPLAARLGVTSNRTEAGLDIRVDPRTNLHLTYFGERDSSESYLQLSSVVSLVTHMNVIVNARRMTQGTGGSLVFNHHFKRASRFSLDGGYSALAFGYDAPRRGVFLGFFAPSFYQRHLLTTRVYGKLRGPLGYDFSGGFGLQQVDQRQALTRALILSPAFTLLATPKVALTLGYTYYNTAQTLGVVSGNGIRLTTDWRF